MVQERKITHKGITLLVISFRSHNKVEFELFERRLFRNRLLMSLICIQLK